MTSDTFEVDRKLTHCYITIQILFMNSTQGAQKVADGCPHAFDGVGVGFVNPVPISIFGPLFPTMANARMRTSNPMVASPLIGVDLSGNLSELMHMRFKGFSIRPMHYTQPDLTTLSSNCAYNWRAVIGVVTVSSSLVGSPTGWV